MSRSRHIGDRLSSTLLSTALAVALVLSTEVRAAEPLPVRTVSELRGIVKAVYQTALSTDLLAPVAKIGFREGETFKAGDILITFDCGRQQQELAALHAVEREMKVAIDTNQYLLQRGAANRNDLEVASARHDKAKAEAAAMVQRLRNCTIAAPFTGTVVELAINTHEIPVSNRPFLTIAGQEDLEIEVIVPSRMLGELKAAAEFQFTIDETRLTYRARIKRTAGVVDAMSQTVKIYAALIDQVPDVLAGMSGTARFPGSLGR